MLLVKHIVLMSEYNQWMNARLYNTAAQLSADELWQDRRAFFGSILGTLNHIMVGDTIWLKRFCSHPANHRALDPVRAWPTPQSLRDTLCPDLVSLRARRNELDELIARWTRELTEADLDHILEYRNTRGAAHKRFASLVMHFFNHQTHHRGQVTTLLSQAGVDVGVTDLVMLIPDEPQ